MMDSETAEFWDPLTRLNFINEISSFIMMLIGSYNYLKQGGKVEQNCYLFRGPDYDGLIYYYSINDELTNA